MASAVHILGFSGSLRKGSFNTALLRVASQLLPPDVTLETFDLAPIPLYNGDVEAAGSPEAVVRFQQRIAVADALLIATPEYNYSIRGAQERHRLGVTSPEGLTAQRQTRRLHGG